MTVGNASLTTASSTGRGFEKRRLFRRMRHEFCSLRFLPPREARVMIPCAASSRRPRPSNRRDTPPMSTIRQNLQAQRDKVGSRAQQAERRAGSTAAPSQPRAPLRAPARGSRAPHAASRHHPNRIASRARAARPRPPRARAARSRPEGHGTAFSAPAISRAALSARAQRDSGCDRVSRQAGRSVPSSPQALPPVVSLMLYAL